MLFEFLFVLFVLFLDVRMFVRDFVGLYLSVFFVVFIVYLVLFVFVCEDFFVCVVMICCELLLGVVVDGGDDCVCEDV